MEFCGIVDLLKFTFPIEIRQRSFADNKKQLFQAYFRDFQIEHLESPWKAFTDGWHAEITAKKLGINSSFILGDYSYVLVRVSRFRDSAKLKKPIPPNQVLQPEVVQKMRNVTVGDTGKFIWI